MNITENGLTVRYVTGHVVLSSIIDWYLRLYDSIFQDLLVTRRSDDYWTYFKVMAIKFALYIGSQFLISAL